MASSPSNQPLDMVATAKRRMERWLLSRELLEHMETAQDVKRPARTGPYISISRQAGAGGLAIARIVGRQLGWDVLDKELLEFMAERYNMPRDMLEIVDETKANWFYDVLGSFLDARIVSHDSFVYHLERIVYLAALHGNVVFVGRGAQFALPRISGIAARVIKPKPLRVQALMARRQISQQQADGQVDELDKNRREFCRRHFHHDIENPAEYDVIINTERLSDHAAAELIVETFCRARRDNIPPEASTVEPSAEE
jgi:cytidylate kinase